MRGDHGFVPVEGDPVTDYIDVTPLLDSHEHALAAVRQWAIENGRNPEEVVAAVVIRRLQLRSPETHQFIGHRWQGAVPKRMLEGE